MQADVVATSTLCVASSSVCGAVMEGGSVDSVRTASEAPVGNVFVTNRVESSFVAAPPTLRSLSSRTSALMSDVLVKLCLLLRSRGLSVSLLPCDEFLVFSFSRPTHQKKQCGP